MKKISMIFFAVIFISSCAMSVSAIPAMHYYGDVNLDRNVDVLDATLIQYHVSEIKQLSLLEQDLADVDDDGKVTIADATMIQRKSAKMISGFEQDDFGIMTDVNIDNISADFDSGKAIPGIAVTFDTTAYSYQGAPLAYEYYVDDKQVSNDRNEFSNFTYVFENAGTYSISVRVYNKYGEYEQRAIEYIVVDKENYDSLIISGVHADSLHVSTMNEVVVTAHAYGGTAPYEYSFELEQLGLVQDYSSSNQLEIGTLHMGTYIVKVCVKDAGGNIAETYYTLDVEEPILM